ncbi:hypothetical protein ACRQ5Q_18775 [Bradyrhizobium sp. PMVTL-01]|uniref:hypothetical protein n=1 Tax=Bradyrhizobium sp. PMVTL-01 TaxID=3434999 RepID=UPI003F70338C
MNEQLLDPLIGELEEVETVTAGRSALTVVLVSHHLERALAPCHVVLSRQPALSLQGGALFVAHLKHVVIYYKQA